MKSAKRVRKADKSPNKQRAKTAKAAPRLRAFFANAKGANQELAMVAGPGAINKLRRFLRKHETADEVCQDGFDRNRIRAVRYELMRLEYLNGNVKAGDRLLARLQDVDC